MTPRTLNYGNYGIFLIMGNAGFCPSTVLPGLKPKRCEDQVKGKKEEPLWKVALFIDVCTLGC